jgi:hypothetical protein
MDSINLLTYALFIAGFSLFITGATLLYSIRRHRRQLRRHRVECWALNMRISSMEAEYAQMRQRPPIIVVPRVFPSRVVVSRSASLRRTCAPCPVCAAPYGFHDNDIHHKVEIDPSHLLEKGWHLA